MATNSTVMATCNLASSSAGVSFAPCLAHARTRLPVSLGVSFSAKLANPSGKKGERKKCTRPSLAFPCLPLSPRPPPGSSEPKPHRNEAREPRDRLRANHLITKPWAIISSQHHAIAPCPSSAGSGRRAIPSPSPCLSKGRAPRGIWEALDVGVAIRRIMYQHFHRCRPRSQTAHRRCIGPIRHQDAVPNQLGRNDAVYGS